MAQMNIIQAVNDALKLEMRKDKRVVILGEDVGKFGGVFRATSGLFEEFGPDRRSGHDRRTFPRINNDRRRWWTDSRRNSKEGVSRS